jgi:hypothetical protein
VRAEGELEAVLVLTTLGAPRRRFLRGRRGREVERAAPEPVPTARATVVRPAPFESRDDADAWLAAAGKGAVSEALAVLNRALHAHRVSAATPHPSDLSPERALVARVGYGDGEAVAGGRYEAARELPRPRRRTRRSMEAPEERFAAILGGRERVLACEALVLCARADLDAGRTREAALQARVALEALLAELPGTDLAGERGPVGEAANGALRGELSEESAAALADAVEGMENALKRRRLGA